MRRVRRCACRVVCWLTALVLVTAAPEATHVPVNAPEATHISVNALNAPSATVGLHRSVPVNVTVVSVMAEGEAGSAAYRIPGLLAFRGGLFAIGTARTQGCTDRKSGQHNVVLRSSDDGGKTFGPLTTVVNVSAVWPTQGCYTPGCTGGVAANPTIVGDAATGTLFIFFSWLTVVSQNTVT